jgi:hypothetical protein
MRRFGIVATVCFLVVGSCASAQIKDKDLKVYLEGVTERGRAVYEYDQAAWHGTDAFFALHPDTAGLTHYICTKTPKGWKIVFPKWNALHDRLLVAYEAIESGEPGKFEATRHDPPWEGPDDLIAKERALELAERSFTHADRPYNSAILPAPEGNLYVYLYPGQVKDTVWPIGGDVRYTISADGKQILETRPLHKTILDMEFKPGVAAVAGYHVHVLSDVPEDTDVFYVLNRKPALPEYVGGGKHIFIVATDGTITVTKR